MFILFFYNYQFNFALGVTLPWCVKKEWTLLFMLNTLWMYRSENSTLFVLILAWGPLCFGVENKKSGIHSPKSDSNHSLGVDYTIIWDEKQLPNEVILNTKPVTLNFCIKNVHYDARAWIKLVFNMFLTNSCIQGGP